MKWNWQYYFQKVESYKNRKPFDVSESQNLVLVPHADDEWIGNSQLLLKKNTIVYYFQFLGNNYNETNKTVRRNELIELKNKIGFELIVSNSYEDYSDLKELLNNKSISNIFIPFPIDWHKEHIKVNTIFHHVLSGLQIKPNLFFYHISVPLPIDFEINYMQMDKSDLHFKKTIFADIYKSQYNTPIKRLNYQLRLNAKGLECYATENFVELSFEEWTDLLNFVKDNYDTKIKELIYYIDDLGEIREKSNQIYKDWKNKN
ncbi:MULTISPECIES: hypothetical protein [Empedobacter]|uniref:hypothetical protein n=1 Tax=Empedobacter TaxID=59734 RepID=UPI0025787C0B|nr:MULTISPECIES: hypothetical protein [Empedobacter]MDM1040645.1 hypothetical protein [Empedobacter brevis]MDM1135580.1 hypothetical protein [Empedobacter sp. R750]